MTRITVVGLGVLVGLGLAACTGGDGQDTPDPLPVAVSGVKLASFTSCEDALGGLRQAAKRVVGPYGFRDSLANYALEDSAASDKEGAEPVPAAPGAADGRSGGSAGGGAPEHSTTNVQESGVDEPDLVKTDGHRIVTVTGGVLRVVDVAARKVTGTLSLTGSAGGPVADDLLLFENRALVLYTRPMVVPMPREIGPDSPDAPGSPDSPTRPLPQDISGPQLTLVDLGAPGRAVQPRVLETLRYEGEYLDARQVGSTVRVVVRSTPRLNFPTPDRGSDADRMRANRRVIDRSAVDDWMPRYWSQSGATTQSGRVDCTRLSRPPTYSGTSLLTVLSVDVSKAMGNGDPVSIAADGNTVYATGGNLYVASDQRWAAPFDGREPQSARTDLFQFDTSQPGRPKHVASGAVRGWILNQYSMSEFDGNLRVAVTDGDRSGSTHSSVIVLTRKGNVLRQVGAVGGLGKGEQIYAVRFVGPVGYVVTFRQTDPLYTLDLSDPAKPQAVSALKITGYSAYLHPAGEDRLIGVGQEATEQGMTTGTQVSVFDVSNPRSSNRVAQFQVQGGNSEVEFDPHAFLYWPKTGTLVVPVTQNMAVSSDIGGPEPLYPGNTAVVLEVHDGSLVKIGEVDHGPGGLNQPTAIRRSLVIGDALWTVSDAGVKANDLRTLAELAWIRF